LVILGDYDLLEEIARGGMGVVYKARQKRLGRIVAVKVILSGAVRDNQSIRRFLEEAAAAAQLQHPNIVAVHEVDFFSMGYVDGPNLAHLVGNRTLPAHQAARYVQCIADAVHYAHERGILHRDLKPSKTMLRSLPLVG
jgi:serine/threonine-protein kinase